MWPSSIHRSPRTAVIVGVLVAAGGVVPVLSGLGLITVRPSNGTPGWMAVCAGAVLMLAGAAVINGYVFGGGPTADGDLPADTPFGILLLQYVLGLSMVGLMTAISGWIAFGPGDRQFSTSIDMPFVSRQSHSSGLAGRIAFGIGAVLMAAFFIGLVFKAARQLNRARRASATKADTLG